MRIFTEKTLKDYIEKHPASRTALQDWVEKVKRAIAIIRFTPQFVYIRFIGTHAEYDKISDIQNI